MRKGQLGTGRWYVNTTGNIPKVRVHEAKRASHASTSIPGTVTPTELICGFDDEDAPTATDSDATTVHEHTQESAMRWTAPMSAGSMTRLRGTWRL